MYRELYLIHTGRKEESLRIHPDRIPGGQSLTCTGTGCSGLLPECFYIFTTFTGFPARYSLILLTAISISLFLADRVAQAI